MKPDRKSIGDYLTIMSGVLGRLVISLVYFLIVANALSVSDFGLFAAAAAVGLVLSRLLAFGFISPTYRVATVKPRILGAYWGGLILLTALSLPLLMLTAFGVHRVFFADRMPLGIFALVVAAEVCGTRIMEFCVISLNGLSRFGLAMRLAVLASALRSVAAILFFAAGSTSLLAWAWWNIGAALLGAAIALGVFLRGRRLRLVPRLYPRRLKDSLMTAGSEVAFYAQSELDKLVVLTFAGDRAAGIYAIAMRLIDLTAIPVRSFNQMLVQHRMRSGIADEGARRRWLTEAGIAIVSTLGMLAFIVILTIQPTLLGTNISRAATVLLPMLMIPALRNLVEYHGDLLYARELVTTRFLLLCGLTLVKLALTAVIIGADPDIAAWAFPLTGVFLLVYIASAVVTYGRLRVSRP
jgi:O-antigen/teichoic acid export membrane protein